MAEDIQVAETIATNAQKGGTEVTTEEVAQATGQAAPTMPEGGLQTADGQPAALPVVTSPMPAEEQAPQRVAAATSSATEQVSKAESIADLERVALEQQQKVAGEAEAAKGEAQSTLDQIKELEEARTPRSELRGEAEEDFGVIKKRENRQAQARKVAELSGKIETNKVQEQDALMRAEQRMASVGTINAEKRRIQTEYARQRAFMSAELNAEAALLAVYNDELTAAEARVDDFVNDATYDDQVKVQRLQFIFNQEQEFYNSLNSDAQSWLKQTMDFTESRLKEKQDRLRDVMNLQIRAAESGVSLGWSAQTISELAADEGGVAEAMNRYAQYVAPVMRQRAEDARRKSGAVDATDEQIRAQIRNKQRENKDLQQVLDDISLSEGLANKDRARFIALEMHNALPEGTTFEQWGSGQMPEVKEQPQDVTIPGVKYPTPTNTSESATNVLGRFTEAVITRPAEKIGEFLGTIPDATTSLYK